MDFFKVSKFKKAHKPDPEKGSDNDPNKSSKVDNADELEDDDFITNEVKRRLKEVRKNSFMVLIPEEEEEEDEEEVGSSEWRDVEAEGRQWWGGFDVVYEKYCERMLLYDRMIAQQLKEASSTNPPAPSPKSSHKKLPSCLSLKRLEEPNDETEHLQHSINDPYQDLETAYVAQLCLTWEVIHCQYSQLSQIVLCRPENPICYNHSAQQLQQFQVLLQRFIENEPFQEGPRAEIYARTRNILPKLLQIPNIQGSDHKHKVEEESDYSVFAPDIIRIIESLILTFRIFLKKDKRRRASVPNMFGKHNLMATPLQQVQSLLDKKSIKLKDIRKSRKGWKKNSWPRSSEDVPLLFGLMDVRIMWRVLGMARINKDQLLWCEEKMKKLGFCDGKLQRDPSPILFPASS
ncbi:hypothetical protein V6N13_084756 [Hibiscus sabdariffa]|uniref:Ribosomal protein L34Ae n=1 Tax=Hibiscus sabdariffa TaxID=183260 RepID=A0ABR2T2M8_9ROSI